MNAINPVRREERGAVLVFAALAGLMLMGLVGLAIDSSRVAVSSTRLQAIADGAALAAALELKDDDVLTGYSVTRQAALSIASKHTMLGQDFSIDANFANVSEGDIVVGYWNSDTRTFQPSDDAPNAVQVRTRMTSDTEAGAHPLVFGSLFGIKESQVARRAVATTSPTDPHILVLDPNVPAAFKMSGGAAIDAEGGAIHVNSNSYCSVDMAGGAYVDASELNTVGQPCVDSDAVTGSVNGGQSYIEDPLAGILPDADSWKAFRNSLPRPPASSRIINKSMRLKPGYYPKGMHLTHNEKVELAPGSYMFGGKGIVLSAYTTLSGTGVTLFIDKGAELDVTGSANLLIEAPLDGPFKGLAIFFHRENTGKGAAKITGMGDVNIGGVLYVPGGELVLAGGGESWQIGALIAAEIKFAGQSTYVIPGNLLPVDWPRTSVLVH